MHCMWIAECALCVDSGMCMHGASMVAYALCVDCGGKGCRICGVGWVSHCGLNSASGTEVTVGKTA